MERLEKVARPATAAWLVVPERVPPPGLAPMATVTVAVEAVWFPKASTMATVTGGAMGAPAPALVGCCTYASDAAAPAVTLKALLVAEVRPVEAATSV